MTDVNSFACKVRIIGLVTVFYHWLAPLVQPLGHGLEYQGKEAGVYI